MAPVYSSIMLFSVALLAGISACGGEKPPATTEPVVTKFLVISPRQDTIYVGGFGRFTGMFHFSDGSSPSVTTVSWSSSDPTIATIDHDGIMYARRSGTLTIRGISENKSDSATVVVLNGSFTAGSTALTALPVDIAYDGRRHRLLLSEPGKKVGVFSPATLTYGTPIALSSEPRGIDVTGRDQLIVALPDEDAIGRVTLSNGAQVETRPLQANLGPRKANALRVANNGHALIGITAAGNPGWALRFIDLDLTSNAESTWTNVSTSGILRIARAADASRVFFRVDDVSPHPAFAYDPSTTARSALRYIAGDGPGSWSTSADGSRVLSWRVRHSADVVPMDSATSVAYNGGPSAISADGAVGYFAVGNSVIGVSFASNAVVKTLDHADAPQLIYAMPDGRALVVVTLSRIYVHLVP